MKCAAAITVLATGVSAFAPPSGLAAPRACSSLKMAAATKSDLPVNLINPDFFWGEEGYRTYVATYKGDALVNRVYPVLDRVREKKLLTKTAELGLLGALEDAGLTLSQAEALLPAVEEAGLLSFAANNADFLLNTAAFLAVEPAELALPLVVGVVKGGPGLLNTVAAAAVLAEVGVAAATQSPVLAALAAVPLLGTAALANFGAGVLADLATAPKVVRAAPAAKSAPKAAVKAGKAAVAAARPKLAAVAAAPKVVAAKVAAAAPKVAAPSRTRAAKKAVGNLSNLPKRRAAA
ncbi:hypothetical protein JKP88DRAFT_49871 [Tribonema minus]|uniref:Uncharacterized protein n=1 Tax=Tribonema minus TaxID=303371 RepID=A0A835YZH4_9STRA|nr:hypothetical protein JKP88DRAFT_49871 [Tribonema minus]